MIQNDLNKQKKNIIYNQSVPSTLIPYNNIKIMVNNILNNNQIKIASMIDNINTKLASLNNLL